MSDESAAFLEIAACVRDGLRGGIGGRGVSLEFMQEEMPSMFLSGISGRSVLVAGLLLIGGCALSSKNVFQGEFLDTGEPVRIELQEEIDIMDSNIILTTIVVLPDGVRCSSKGVPQDPLADATNVACPDGRKGVVRRESRTVTSSESTVLESGRTEEKTRFVLTYGGEIDGSDFRASMSGTIRSTYPSGREPRG